MRIRNVGDFPFIVGRGPVNEGLMASLAEAKRWYWGVQDWLVLLQMPHATVKADDGTTFVVDNLIGTAFYGRDGADESVLMALDHTYRPTGQSTDPTVSLGMSGVGDFTGPLKPADPLTTLLYGNLAYSLFAYTPVPGQGPYPNLRGYPDNGTALIHDLSKNVYAPGLYLSGFMRISQQNNDSQGRGAELGIGLGILPPDKTFSQSVDIDVSFDGHSFQLPGFVYGGFLSSATSGYQAGSIECGQGVQLIITPKLYWLYTSSLDGTPLFNATDGTPAINPVTGQPYTPMEIINAPWP